MQSASSAGPPSLTRNDSMMPNGTASEDGIDASIMSYVQPSVPLTQGKLYVCNSAEDISLSLASTEDLMDSLKRQATGEAAAEAAAEDFKRSKTKSLKNIYRVDFDCTDPDNLKAVVNLYVQIQKDDPGAILHLVVIVRPFTSAIPKAIKDPITGNFTIVTYPNGLLRPSVTIVTSDIRPYLIEQDWEEQCRNYEEEELLAGIYAAQFRSTFINSFIKFGFDLNTIEIYFGGRFEKAGLSALFTPADWRFLDPECKFCVRTSVADLNAHDIKCAGMTREELHDQFKTYALAPELELRKVKPLSDFTEFMNENPEALIHLWGAGPFTGIWATFKNDPKSAKRVKTFRAMSGSWNGKKNHTGLCFNNAVSYEATKACLNLFHEGIVLWFTSETCKAEDDGKIFFLSADDIRAIPASGNGVMIQQQFAAATQQWCELTGSVTAEFDTVCQLPIEDLLLYAEVFKAEIIFGENVHKPGTIFEKIGMTIVATSGPVTTLTNGFYVVGENVKAAARGSLLKIFHTTFNPV